MESFIVKEVHKRPVIYDKSLRAIENCKEVVQDAFQDISTEIEHKMNVVVTGPTIEKIWLRCLQCFKFNRQSSSSSSKNVPSYFMDMMFMLDHLSHRDPLSSGTVLKTQDSIWKGKRNNNIKRKGNKMPKLDDFASKKLRQDEQLVKSIDSMERLLKAQIQKETAECTTNVNSIENNYLTIIYEKLAQIPSSDVDKCFLEVLEIIDKFQTL